VRRGTAKMAASDDFDDSTRRISPDDLAEEPATNRKMPTAVDAGVQPGDVLVGKYRVERMLGRGGMGVVVAAHHLQLDEKVALKFLLPETIQDARAVARFLREARATVKIKGEHVARVLDVGQLESGSPYIVMEYLEGVDLAGWLKQRGPLPIALAVDFVLQACEAVADAHAVGIVHRDLKPANLFCVERSDGQLSIKVLDFGISKVTTPGAPGHDMTGTTALVGTPFYMSPEQMQASKSVDARTDIWALGVILFELVTGRPPFDGQTLTELAIRVANEPAPPARALRSDVPLGLEEIIATCLTKARDGRYPSIAELAIALKDFGSKNARLSVERVLGTLRQAGVSGAALPQSGAYGAAPPSSPTLPSLPTATTTAAPQTGASWARTGARRASAGKKAFVWIAGAVALAVLAVLGVLVVRRVSPATMASSAVVVTTSAPVTLASTPGSTAGAPSTTMPAPSTTSAPPTIAVSALPTAPTTPAWARSPGRTAPSSSSSPAAAPSSAAPAARRSDVF